MAITADQLTNRSLAAGAVIRVIRSWPGGPPRGTVRSGVPMARAKRLIAMGFVELVEQPEEIKTMPCGTGGKPKGKPRPRPK